MGLGSAYKENLREMTGQETVSPSIALGGDALGTHFGAVQGDDAAGQPFVAGVAMDEQPELARAANERAAETELYERFGLNSGSVEGIMRYLKQLDGHNEQMRKRGVRKDGDITDILLAMDMYKASLLDEISQLQAELERIDGEIAQLDIEIVELEAQLQAINDAIERADQSGEFALDEDGKLADADAEAAIRAYEERTGETVDRNNFDAVLDALAQQRDMAEAELQAKRTQRNDLVRDRGDVDSKLNRRQAEVNEIDAAQGDTLTFPEEEFEIQASAEETELFLDEGSDFLSQLQGLNSGFNTASMGTETDGLPQTPTDEPPQTESGISQDEGLGLG